MEPIAFIPRIAFAGMFLRLGDDGALRVGPKEAVRTHAHLMTGIAAHKEGLAELMHDLCVANVFTTETTVSYELLEQVAEFLTIGCNFGKGLVMSGMTFSTCYYLWAHKNGYVLPSLQQLYAAMDEFADRGYSEHVVQWVKFGLTEDQKALIPRFYE